MKGLFCRRARNLSSLRSRASAHQIRCARVSFVAFVDFFCDHTRHLKISFIVAQKIYQGWDRGRQRIKSGVCACLLSRLLVTFVTFVGLFWYRTRHLLGRVSFVTCVGLFCHVCRCLLSHLWVSFVIAQDIDQVLSFVTCVGLFCHICRSLLSH